MAGSSALSSAPRLTHAYVVTNFPSKPAGINDEDIECIFADVFLCFIIYEHSLNLVLIALVTVALFREAREIACRRCLEFTVFRLFDDADIEIAAGCTIRIKCSEKFYSLVCSRGNSPSELQSLQAFGAPNAVSFSIEFLERFFLRKQTRKIIRVHML
jgi:hypothetical protein